LLAFSRKQIVQPRVLNLNSVVHGLQDMLARLIGSHIALECGLGAELPDVYADEANLEQIVVNLVVNARDAMPQGGRLAIRTSAADIDAVEAIRNPTARAGRFVCLSVKDTGCGMSPDTLSHIFEPFFTTKEVGKGTGLGLATVYGIVAQHEGWIDVASKLNHGTTVSVFLPGSDLKAEPTNRAGESELRGGTETILFVEDEPEVREIVVEILRQHGYEVVEAGDGIEAMTVWEQMGPKIDILVTDIVMPNGVAGNVLADRLRAEKPNLKVIYSSGYSEDFATGAALLNQGAKFLQKPYKLEGLLRAVRDCLDG
jgi:CheY-like chemotaxis protein